MIKKILIFNRNQYNQFWCTLIEGLKTHKHLELYSTTKINYSSDIVIKSQHYYEIKVLNGDDEQPIWPSISSTIIDEDEYVEECEGLMDECDLIIIGDDNLDQTDCTSACFINKDGHMESHLQEYAVANHRHKIAFVDVTSIHFSFDRLAAEQDARGRHEAFQPKLSYRLPINFTMWGDFVGGHPIYSKVYFKREKDLDLEWPENVVPFARSSEERYFTGGKNFTKIWGGKSLDIASLFRIGGNSFRREIRNILVKHYGESEKCNVELLVDEVDDRVRDIDKKIYGFEGDELNGTIHHNYSYYEVLLKSKISIEAPQHPGFGFYTYRMMESLANGCCYFYPPPSYNIDFPNGLFDGEDFIIYHSADDLIEKIEYYLSHEEEMRTIAENGFNKLLKYHTSEVRAKEFLETCERYMND